MSSLRRGFAAALCAGLALGGFIASAELLKAARPEYGLQNSGTRRKTRQFSAANRTSWAFIQKKGLRSAPAKKHSRAKAKKRARLKAKWRNRR